MMYLLTLLVLGVLASPVIGQDASTNTWPATVLPTVRPTVLPTVRPTPTPIPGGGGDGDGDGDHDHDHKNKANVETNIAIGQFTINVGKIDVDIEKREKKGQHDGAGSIPGFPGTGATSSSSSTSADDEDHVVANTISSLTHLPGSLPGSLPGTGSVPGTGSGSGSGSGSGPIMGGGNDHGNNNKHNTHIDTDVKIGEFTINVGKIKVDVNKCKKEENSKPPRWPILPLGDDVPQFPDDPVSTEPGSDEVVLGESDVSTQGLPPIGGGVVSTAPVIYSFTYKISPEKKVQVDATKPVKQVVTFIIRGAHFDISSLLGVDADDLTDGLASLLEPKVYLGAIPLKVVKFTDKFIEARFEDIEDQKSFKPGSYLVRVKVLHVEKKLGVLSADGSSDISALGGLSLPELGHIGSGLPVLPVIKSPISSPISLISLFAGLKFDTTSLLVTFSSADADKIAKAAKGMW